MTYGPQGLGAGMKGTLIAKKWTSPANSYCGLRQQEDTCDGYEILIIIEPPPIPDPTCQQQ